MGETPRMCRHMRQFYVLAFAILGCSGSPSATTANDTEEPPLVPPGSVVQDCTQGCDVVSLDTAGIDGGILVAKDTSMAFDLGPNLCARLTTPEGSQSALKAVDSGYTLTRCQVFDNKNPTGKHWGLMAGPAGVASWVRAETGKSEYPGFCELSCTTVTP